MVRSLVEVNHENSADMAVKMQVDNVTENQIAILESSQVKDNLDDVKVRRNEVMSNSNKIEKTFDDTVHKAMSTMNFACNVNISVCILLLGFGVLLVLDSIILSIFNGVAWFSVVLAILGVGSLASLLLISPQAKMAKTMAKNIQYKILYSGYVRQLELTKNSRIEESVDDVQKISMLLEQITFDTVDKIENVNGIKSNPKN